MQNNETMKVKITQCTGPNFWYGNCVGEVFEVYKSGVTISDGLNYEVAKKENGFIYYILAQDCEIIDDSGKVATKTKRIPDMWGC